MSDEVERRTTRDGAPTVDRPTTRIDALRPLVDAVERLEKRTDHIVEQIETSLRDKETRRRAERDRALVALVDAAFREHERRSLLGFRIKPTIRGLFHD